MKTLVYNQESRTATINMGKGEQGTAATLGDKVVEPSLGALFAYRRHHRDSNR